MRFWNTVSRIILKGRLFVLLFLLAITLFLSTQWKYTHFTHTEANILPSDHPVNVQYNKFLDIFGEEGNLILLAVKDSNIYGHGKFNNWNTLSENLKSYDEVAFVISWSDIKKLRKDTEEQKFTVVPLFEEAPKTDEKVES